MVVDCHCHAGTGDGLRGPWDTEARIDAYLARAERARIDRTIVFPVFNSDYSAANDRLAAIVGAHRPRLTGFASVHPRTDAGRIDRMVGRAVEVHGFRGIKVHGFDALPTREVCEAARRWRIPLLADVINQPAVVEMLASQYPDVNFIVPHLGGFADDWMVQLQIVDQMTRYPNVFGDTSGVRYFDALVFAIRRAGPGKLLFGSDGPQLHPGVELCKIKALGLPAQDEQRVLGGNILGLIGPRQPT